MRIIGARVFYHAQVTKVSIIKVSIFLSVINHISYVSGFCVWTCLEQDEIRFVRNMRHHHFGSCETYWWTTYWVLTQMGSHKLGIAKNIHKGYFQCISYNLLAANRQNIQQTKPGCYAIYPYVLDLWGNSQDSGEGVAEFWWTEGWWNHYEWTTKLNIENSDHFFTQLIIESPNHGFPKKTQERGMIECND